MGKVLGGARIAPTIAGVTLLAVSLALVLGGCVSADPVVTPQPQASATPLFATDADALKAAEEAYAAYSHTSDLISSEGGQNVDRIVTRVTNSQFKRDQEVFATYRKRGYFSKGTTKFDSLSIESVSELGSGVVAVVAYLCSDFSDIRLVDADGRDITPTDLKARSAMEITFSSSPNRSLPLLVDRSEQWSGKDFC